MSDPTCDPTDGKRRSEQICGYSQPMQKQRCIKLDICFKITVRILFRQEVHSNIFYFSSKCIEGHVPRLPEHFLSRGREHFRAWVACSVDTMSKTHKSLSTFEFPTHDRLRAVRLANLEHHIKRRSGRAAMKRTLQSANRPNNCRDQIRTRRNDHSGREGGNIQPVIHNCIQISFQATDFFWPRNFTEQHV